MDRDTINDHTLLGNKNFLSAVLSSVLKEKIKILNPINGVFNATVHFYTIFVQIIWYPTTKVEQHHMSWVALMACKLMSEVWWRDAWKKLCLIWYRIFDLLYIYRPPLRSPFEFLRDFESAEVFDELPYLWELVAPHDRRPGSGNLGPDDNQARGTLHILGIYQNKCDRWTFCCHCYPTISAVNKF